MTHLGGPGFKVLSSYQPREFLRAEEGLEIVAGTIYGGSRDRFGGLNSSVLRPGTILGYNTTSKMYTPLIGADVASAGAATSATLLWLNCVTQFTVADNVKIGRFSHQQIADGSAEQNLGAITAISTTSKTINVTTAITTVSVPGDCVWVEPATADGTGDAYGILLDTVKVTDPNGANMNVQAQLAIAGFVKTSKLLNLTARAKLQLSGLGGVSAKTNFLFDDNA